MNSGIKEILKRALLKTSPTFVKVQRLEGALKDQKTAIREQDRTIELLFKFYTNSPLVDELGPGSTFVCPPTQPVEDRLPNKLFRSCSKVNSVVFKLFRQALLPRSI